MNPDAFDPGPLAEVQLHASGKRSTLVFARDLGHAPERVWAVLTDPDQLRQWAPFAPDRDLAIIGPATLRMIDGSAVQKCPAEILRATPPSLLEYNWDKDLLTWELTPKGAGTRLTLHHTVESPDWVPKAAAGWHLCLVVAEHLLDGNPIGPICGQEAMNYGWQELHDANDAVMKISS